MLQATYYITSGYTLCDTITFHNFKSQDFKLSVSNPKNKYVAYVSVLSQISNCQGLGRKNKHAILKTDRMTRDDPGISRARTLTFGNLARTNASLHKGLRSINLLPFRIALYT